MKKILEYLRIDEWIYSKITFMTGVLLVFSYINKTAIKEVFWELLVYFLYVSMFMAVSYVSNDFSDIEVDKKAGKKKVIAKIPRWLIWLSFVIMVIIGNVPVLILVENKLYGAILIAVTYFLGLAYSTLGIRFKEKGVYGLIECSFAQRCMPLLMIALIEKMETFTIILLVLWIVISFFDGMRYILIHQVLDMENDLRSGVNTFVTKTKKNYRGTIVAFLVVEIILMLVALLQIIIENYVVWIVALVLYALFEYSIYVVLNVYANNDMFVSFDSVPLEAFLNMLFPVLVAVCFANKIGYWMLAYSLVVVLICFKAIKVKWGISRIYILTKIKKEK